MAIVPLFHIWKVFVPENDWKRPGENKIYKMNPESMRKDEYAFRATRLPIVLGPTEVLLYNADWQDDGESYVVCDKKHLF
jgi:hypothetical protein